MSDLAKRAVACKAWRWQEGMLVLLAGWRVVRLVHDTGIGDFHGVVLATGRYLRLPMESDSIPDPNDPATIGCLMQMLRDKYPTAEIEISWLPASDTTTIRIDDGHQWLAGKGATLAEALVAALEVERCPV